MMTAVLVVAVVAVIALVMRMASRGGTEEITAPPGSAPADAGSAADAWDDDEGEDAEEDFTEGGMVHAAAITSDGTAFVPHRSGIELIPPGEDDDMLREVAERHGAGALAQAAASAPRNPKTGRLLVQWKPGQSLTAGDVVAVRVVRGAPDFDPWRVECLGRDRDYRPFAFETEEAARTAAELIQTRIVRPPRDEDGQPIPIGAEDFMVARRQWEETEQALAMDDDPEEPPPR